MLLFPGAKLLDAAGPVQVFADARLPDGRPAYETRLVSAFGGAVRTDAGVHLPTDAWECCRGEAPDTLLIGGGDAALAAAEDPDLVRFVAEMASRCRRTGSVCLGAFILARTGFLEGRPATTHWEGTAALARAHPKIRVQPDAIYCEAAHPPGRTLWTSAGVTAGIDMALAMVAADLGREEALRLARALVLYVRRMGGQSQFSPALARQQRGGGRFDGLVAKILDDPAADWRAPALAAAAHMSERNFARRFAEEMGETPARFVERVRVEEACERLAAGAALGALPGALGFGAAERMRRAFHRVKGVSPSDYAARFGRG